MVPKWPQNDPKIAPNDLNGFKVTSQTISIEVLPLLRSFWVVTWLVCDKFEFGDKNGPKLLRNGQKWPKIVRNGQKWLLSLKKTRIDLVYVTSGPFWSLKGGWVTFFQSRGQNGPKVQFFRPEKFFMKEEPKTFPTSNFTLKPYYGAFSGNFKRVFLRKMFFCVHPFQPRTTIFGLLRGNFWPKCFQFIQSKIAKFGTQMRLPKSYNFWSQGPPWPPMTPLTPPRGPGGPKMAKMHSSSPMMIVYAKKAISGG